MTISDALKKWLFSRERMSLLRWSGGFFTFATLLLLIVGARYFFAYSFPSELLGVIYAIAAFISHFASIMLIAWLGVALPLIILLPFKKFVIPACVLLVSIAVSVVLLDSQIFTAHRFHFTLLTIKILGWKTWGFGIFYFALLLVFNSFLARLAWNRHVTDKKKLYLAVTLPLATALLLFTHATHIWADAAGYVPVTGFTTTLPMFYPSTAKKQMVKFGLANISNRRSFTTRSIDRSELRYPLHPLRFASRPARSVLIIGVDAMRSDVATDSLAPSCMKLFRDSGAFFGNHWSGGNSTKMGLFSLFYGIPPTYQQHFESKKQTPILIDRLLESNYAMGIFTSAPLYRPASLDVTAFAKIADLRLETKIPGPQSSFRNDSAITEEWKQWLDRKPAGKPFFGFLFFDALCCRTFPDSYKSLLPPKNNKTDQQRQFDAYKVSIRYIDSLIGTVVADLARRQIMDSTIIIITADHGEEFDDNKLGVTGHGSAFSDYQLRVPLIIHWPGKPAGVVTKRTSHNDIIATLIADACGCENPTEDFCSGRNLYYSEKQWDWLITGSYYNFGIIEPRQVTVQFPGGYYEVRDHRYRLIKKASPSSNIAAAFDEMGKYFKK